MKNSIFILKSLFKFMEQPKHLSRTELTALASHSDLNPEQIRKTYNEEIPIHRAEYEQFLKWILLVGGISLLGFGLVFFFAFNWRDMPASWKFTTVWVFLLGFLVPAFLPKSSLLTKQLLLTVSSLLVGVLFAVFGQVYQTGAFTYQYIALWLALIAVWVVTMHFAPLWIIFHALVCVGLFDYFDNYFSVYLYLYVAVALTVVWNELKPGKAFPYWYLLTLLTPAIFFSTARTSAIIAGDSFIARFDWVEFALFILCELALFGLAFYKKWLIPIAHIVLSLMVVMNAKLLNVYHENLLIPAFATLVALVGSVFLLVYLRNYWKNGKA